MPIVACDPKKKRTHRSRVLRQLLDMEAQAFEDALNAEKPIERASAMRAYDVLEERRLMVLGKPGRLSGRVDPEKQKPKRRSQAQDYSDAPSDPTAPPPAK